MLYLEMCGLEIDLVLTVKDRFGLKQFFSIIILYLWVNESTNNYPTFNLGKNARSSFKPLLMTITNLFPIQVILTIGKTCIPMPFLQVLYKNI